MNDKYLWLENIQGEDAINWVQEKSDESIKKLKAHPLFTEIENKALEFFGTKEKIPYVTLDGDFVYNLWNDDEHVQGIYRRTTIEEYLKSNPSWENIIDLDKLSKDDGIKWVFQGFEINNEGTRALAFLSPGGSDANVMREFDLIKREFIKDGYSLPESKGSAEWIDNNLIRINRIFDEDSATDSGYGRTVRDWKRGEPLLAAKTIYEVLKSDMYAYSKLIKTKDVTYQFLGRVIDFYNIERQILINGDWRRIQLPTMCEDFGIVKNKYIIQLKTKWNDFNLGDVVSYDLATHDVSRIISVSKNESIYQISPSLTGLYVIIDEDIKGNLYKFTLNEDGSWTKKRIEMPLNGTINFLESDYQSDKFFVGFTSFNRPATYYYGEGEKILAIAKVAPSFFEHEKIEVNQLFAKSLDGTKVPYYVVHKKGINYNGLNPTILYGYGGFEISLKPTFSNGIGSSWLERGGVWVYANIRGGGEYGPAWHQAALKENRHRAYEDFFAIAEDLFQNNITSRDHLGAMGGSNGGLLMGVCYTQRPDLFKAINCGVPLLDMHRFHKLLAGASWMAEYGNPDDEKDGAYIRSISPYQNIKDNKKYPVMFLNTSTKDDRVHPGHARKFAAKLFEYKHPVYYYENVVGGHSGASNFKETAFKHALDMIFFWRHLSQ